MYIFMFYCWRNLWPKIFIAQLQYTTGVLLLTDVAYLSCRHVYLDVLLDYNHMRNQRDKTKKLTPKDIKTFIVHITIPPYNMSKRYCYILKMYTQLQ